MAKGLAGATFDRERLRVSRFGLGLIVVGDELDLEAGLAEPIL